MHCYDTNSGGGMNEEQFDREFDLDRPMSDRSMQIKSLLEQIFNENAELLERLKDD
jgi:hypothetical protein